MKYIEKYLGDKTYMFPNGAIATPEATLEHFPAALVFAHIVETDESGQVMFAMQNLAAMRTHYSIDQSITEDEAIQAIQTIINIPPPEPEPSANDIIAAQMQFDNIMKYL